METIEWERKYATTEKKNTK